MTSTIITVISVILFITLMYFIVRYMSHQSKTKAESLPKVCEMKCKQITLEKNEKEKCIKDCFMNE
jgi:uncharacterized membrane protein